jgi:hypothetical protein
MKLRFIPLIFTFFIFSQESLAQESGGAECNALDHPCLIKEIEKIIPTIEKQDWRDQSLRELAKSYAYEGQTDKAIAIISQISSNDTKAMTIRGIGFAAASLKWDIPRYRKLFLDLEKQAQAINHPPSQGIAYTYISMAQALAGDDEGARKTAAAMTNAALRNKAYGESAEIQAERGDLQNALLSLSAIDTPSYKNKAYDTVSRIFLGKALTTEAYETARRIDNPFYRAKSLQRILNKSNPEEQDMEPIEDMAKAAE